MPLGAVMSMWRQGKITLETCLADCLRVREVGANRMISFLEWYAEQQARVQREQLTARIMLTEQQQWRPFRHHDNIDKWIMQYHGDAVQVRFKTLLLRGTPRSGKTQKACSIYGFARTLVVNGQVPDNNLPSLAHLDLVLFLWS